MSQLLALSAISKFFLRCKVNLKYIKGMFSTNNSKLVRRSRTLGGDIDISLNLQEPNDNCLTDIETTNKVRL